MRIIPDRAGFTTPSAGSPAASPDHPRSRGVYTTALAGTARRVGSSPLARGLLDVHLDGALGERIIPARAGFTHFVWLGLFLCWDHPRSRGVYHIINRRVKHYAGSSPLARGLRDTIEEVHVDLGIIPARAGFTVGFKVVKCKP